MNRKIIKERAMAIKPWLVDIRRDLHMYPELSLQEKRTSQVIKNCLKEMGIEYVSYEGQNAVVGIIRGSKEGKTVAIRADMDALPLQEKNMTSYKSKTDGVMHACGHDAHITILLGTARVLNEIKDELNGNIKLLFQPAEETVGGAEDMIKAGCMENPRVDYVIGLHVMPYLPCGMIETKFGALNGASDRVEITIKGNASHGAYPELGTDAIAIAGHVITALQDITSRKVSPLDSVVLTLGTINGGTKNNIIADEVKLGGILRTVNPSTRESVKKRIKRIVEGICTSFEGEGLVEIVKGYEPLINDNEVVDVIISTAKDVLGEKSYVFKEKPSLGVEDFSYFINASKGAFYHLGCGNAEKNIIAPLHNYNFDIDEDCLPLGVMMHASVALELLKNKSE